MKYEYGAVVEVLLGQNLIRWRKTCPSGTLLATNCMWTGLGLSLGLCSDRRAANVALLPLL